MDRKRVVVVEDEPDIRSVIAFHLEREGFAVEELADGAQALTRLRQAPADLVLLDVMLPGLDGIELCRRLRSDALTRGIPVIMVTARGEEPDVVLGLGVGADDYLAKPFSPRELVARVRAVLRRAPRAAEGDEGERITRDGLVIDLPRHEATLDGESLILTATEFRLLRVLAAQPGRVFSREQLVGRVIGDGAAVIDRNIDVHVLALRKKLGERRDLIETVRGVGYRFRA